MYYLWIIFYLLLNKIKEMADNHGNSGVGIFAAIICWAAAAIDWLAGLDMLLAPIVKIVSITAGMGAIWTFYKSNFKKDEKGNQLAK
jgi:hypothetical protein